MTNTQQITINQTMTSRGHPVMHGWTEQNQVVIRARIRERELEAASERLAAAAHATSPIGIRRTVGRMLISAGRRIAGEPAVAGSPAARPARPMAA
jgi:hypothetical protein